MTPRATFGGSGDFPSLLASKQIHLGNTIVRVNIRCVFEGTIRMEMTADGTNWEYVGALTSGILSTYTFTNPGGNVQYRIIGYSGAKLKNEYNADGSYSKAAIRIELAEV